MGALLGLVLGLGLLLVWSAWWPQHPSPTAGGTPRTPRLRPLLDSAGLAEVSAAGFAVVCTVSALASATVVLLASRTAPVALVFGAMGAYLPVALVRGRAERRLREFAEVWPEAVDNLASGVRAGMSLPEALAALADRGPEPLRPAFRGFALDYQAGGRALEKYLSVATKVTKGSRGRTQKGTGGPKPAVVRAWAKDNGHDVPERGRIPQDVKDAYDAAH